ncbi:helix-turn-helix domain-containing protein [Gelidibacter sp. F2691]|nr:helix-turn-helix domain-containing protein [Gelidibacter sp. F2691]
MINKYITLICFFLGHYLYAEVAFNIADSLKTRSYDYLFDSIEDHNNDTTIQSIYLKAFLNKAKSEEHWEELVNGYKNYMHYSSAELKLIYADSMIYAANISKDDALIGSAYLSKGIMYYGRKNHILALDNYLLANEYISKTEDDYQKYKVKYNIAHIKYYLGFYDEAIVLFEHCLKYFENENTRAYLNTIHSLALCYNRVGDFGFSSEMNALGLAEGEKFTNDSMKPYFIHLEGINHYFQNNYATSIEKISHSLPFIADNKDFANFSVGNFYIGKSYWALKKPELAITYFEKVDKTFDTEGYIRPDLRENFEILINYYKSKDNPKAKLHYIKKLLKADSILNANYKYLSGKMHKEYDTLELLKEKETIQKLLQKRNRNDIIFISTIAFLFFVLIFLAYRYIKNKKTYKRRFEELIKKNGETQSATSTKTIDKSSLDINSDAVASVLKQLEKFEKDEKFREKDWTLVKLSAAFNSNTKYLSKIVYHYRGKKFVEYINDLKIDYIIGLLKNDKIIRNYTNKALGEESGFSSTQRFTNAFISRTGISPSYFIQELNKQME